MPNLVFAAAIYNDGMFDDQKFSKLMVLDMKFGTIASEEIHFGEITDIHVYDKYVFTACSDNSLRTFTLSDKAISKITGLKTHSTIKKFI